MDGYTQGHVKRKTMTFYFVYPKPSIFVPDTEKCPSSRLIHLRYRTKKSLKNKEKRLDYIGRFRRETEETDICHYRIYFGNFEKYLPKKAVCMVSYIRWEMRQIIFGSLRKE